MTYVKEAHGGTFRRVALSALIDTADRPAKREANVQTTRVIRHVLPSDIVAEDVVTEPPSSAEDSRGNRKLLFKKRSTSSTCAVIIWEVVSWLYCGLVCRVCMTMRATNRSRRAKALWET